MPDYAQLIATVPVDKEYNVNGSGLNRVLCYYENVIMQHCIHNLNVRGIEIAILMFDGCMIYGDYYNDSDLLEEITTYVESMMPSLNMKWDYKEHDTTFQIPDDWKEKAKEEEDDETEFVATEGEAAAKLYSLYPNWKYCLGNLYARYEGLWTNDRIVHNKIISTFTKELRTNKRVSYGNTATLKPKLLTELCELCIDNDWIKRTEKSSLGKLLFEDGYLDLRKKEFIYGFDFDENIVFVYKIPHNYQEEGDKDEENSEYRKSVKQRMFLDPHGNEVGENLIYNLSRGLAGDVMKKIIFALGKGDTGKSTISLALLRSCGGYVGTFNANNLAHRQTGQDQAQQNRTWMLKKDKRILLSNEINTKFELNGNLIKSLTSGGKDEIEGRGHGGNETTFAIQFLLLLLANDMSPINPCDQATINRVRCYTYKKPYVHEPEDDTE